MAASLNNLAALYGSQGRYAEAEPLYVESIEILNETVGAVHPNTKVVKKNYELLQVKMDEP